MENDFINEFDEGTEDMAEAVDAESVGESKADKFKRLAQGRTNNALKQITGIGKLATSAYEYTPEQVDKIFGALQAALDEAKGRFEKKAQVKETFTL